MIIFPHRWLSDKFDLLYDRAKTRWGRACLGAGVGAIVGIGATIWEYGFEGWPTALTGMGAALVGLFAGFGLTFVDDRAAVEQRAEVSGESVSTVKTILIYLLICLVGLVVIVVGCVMASIVIMQKH